MYLTICPNCGRGFRDTENRFSIADTLKCLICRAEDVVEEETARWENEGGHSYILNDSC